MVKTGRKNIILGFDVSNNSCSVAVSSGQDILAYEEDLRASTQAESLMLRIESVLRDAKLEYGDIDYLAVTNGPGSFTGIRIGLAAAEGILMASNIQSFVISNFEIGFYRLQMQIKYFDKALILLKAYRNQLYYQEFDHRGNKGEYGVIDVERVQDLLTSDKNEKIACAGSGIPEIYEQIKNTSHISILPRFARVKALHICRYADEKISNGEVESYTVQPLYIRPPDAKIADTGASVGSLSPDASVNIRG